MHSMKKSWLIAATISMSLTLGIYASPAPDGHTEPDADTTTFKQWSEEWKLLSTDWTQVSMIPGATEKEMNFAWYTKQGEECSFEYSTKKSMKNSTKIKPSEEVTTQIDSDGNSYKSCKVTVKDLAGKTTYYYRVNGRTVQKFTTGSRDAFSFIFVGDPQIGSSNPEKAKKAEDIAKPKFKTAQYDSVMNDSYNWADTLQKAVKKSGGKAAFILSAGDQIQTNAKKVKNTTISEIEYAGYLSPDTLKSVPAAPTVGNHDADNKNFGWHFNVPNLSPLGNNGYAGGDYYFTYNNALFIMLNTQSTNIEEHKQFITNTVQANPQAKWRIVTLHQDIYGSAEHSNEPEIVNLRYALVPIFQDNGIDVVLTGHDHAYSRSKILYNDKNEAVTYTQSEFSAMLEKDIDMASPSQLFTAPGNIKENTTDLEEGKYLNYLKSVMDSDAAVSRDYQASVSNPKGILYMTANSASGSKYYDLVPRKQTYIAERWQEDVPTYAIVKITDNSFSIETYRTDTQKLIDQVFTITK